MFKNNVVTFGFVSLLVLTKLSAYTLQESVVETLNTNPVIQERLKNFRATQQDLNIAESEYYPTVDLRTSYGYNRAGELKTGAAGEGSDFNHNVQQSSYTNYESSLTFTQNLFDGFGTIHRVDYEETRTLAAAYKYLETANDTAFKMVNAYVKVLRTSELVGTARENVKINEDIYNKVQALFDAGLTTDSEVKKIQATLSLARSNLSVKKNNARDAEYEYRRVLGRLPEIDQMEKPTLDVKMPDSIETAALYAIENNPSLLVSRYNIKGAESLYKQRKKDFYPTIDLEVSQTFNDHDQLNNGFDQADDRFKARVVLNYNLYRGGADSANVQKHVSKIAQEIEIQRDLKRQVVEGLDLSWNAYHMVKEQLKDLKDYSAYSEKTLTLYKEEYDLGRRSLLDLLSAQNDVINSRSQIIEAEYDQLFAEYRILDAMGLLVLAVNGTADEFTSKVNLHEDSKAAEILDTVPVKLDVDSDNITDNLDLCDNTLKGDSVMPYGCKKIKRDDDKDGVYNEKDECPFTPEGTIVTSRGCEKEIEVVNEELDTTEELADSDNDGVVDSVDTDTQTPEGYTVDEVGRATAVTLLVNFAKNSIALPKDLDEKIVEFATYLINNPELKANIVGHTSRTSVSNKAYNQRLSKQRANRVKQELVKYGVDASRLTTDGKGFTQPVADNATIEGRIQNRRVEIDIIRDTEVPEETEETSVMDQEQETIETETEIENDICTNSPVGFNLDEKGCIISKTMHLNFPSNSSFIPQSANAKVKEFADFLRDNPSYKIKIIGHTSIDGAAKYNKWISKKRANRFMNALVSHGVDPSRMSTDGRGEEDPITDDLTPQMQEKNRRLEIEIIQ